MLQILTRKDYVRVKPLASGLRDQSMALAVLEGTRPGIALVNDKVAPSALFIAASEGSFTWTYLAGDSSDRTFQLDLNQWLFDDHWLGSDITFSFLVYDDASWEPALATILHPRAVIPDRRLLLACTERPESWRSAIPDGYSIRSIDQDLLNSGVQIPEKVSQWLDHNFGSRAAFLDRGFGAAAVCDDQVVAWCLADSVVGDRADIGVETDEAHQRKGLAYCTTCMTLEQAFDRGLRQIGWHCHFINIPSVKTAEKVGFSLQREYRAYAVHFDVEEHANIANVIGVEFITQATEALERGACQESNDLLERMFGFCTPQKAAAYILAARAAAGCDESDVAFERLASAVKRGWSPTTDANAHPELVSLQADSRWLDLVS
ncbi:GNAT family N-acetyltransferase [Candidatus Bipolaricaulota bacterium]